MFLYGFYAKGTVREDSDIDFAVDAPEITDEEDFLKLIKPLRKVIGGKADFLHLNSIKNDILINEITEKGNEKAQQICH